MFTTYRPDNRTIIQNPFQSNIITEILKSEIQEMFTWQRKLHTAIVWKVYLQTPETFCPFSYKPR